MKWISSSFHTAISNWKGHKQRIQTGNTVFFISQDSHISSFLSYSEENWVFTDYLLRGGGAKETQKNISLHFHWTALVDCQLSSEKLTFQHLSVGSNILKCWKGETKNFSYAVFLSDLLSHMFPSGMHKKSLWIIHKHLGRNQLILLNKKVGQNKLTAAVLLCSILKKRTPDWERNFPSIVRTVHIKCVCVCIII